MVGGRDPEEVGVGRAVYSLQPVDVRADKGCAKGPQHGKRTSGGGIGSAFGFGHRCCGGSRLLLDPGKRVDGSFIEAPGVSIIEYAGNGQFSYQWDLFYRLSVKAVQDESNATAKR